MLDTDTPLVVVILAAAPTGAPVTAALYRQDALVGQLTAAMFSAVHLRGVNWFTVVASPGGGSLLLAAAFTSKGRVRLQGHHRESDGADEDFTAFDQHPPSMQPEEKPSRLFDSDIMPTVLRWFNVPMPAVAENSVPATGTVRILCATGDDALHCE
jgi:hypothetical protein